jgi:hypothetical protein
VISTKLKPEPRLKLVSEYPIQKQKEIIEALVFVDKFNKAQRHRRIKTEADLKAFIVGFLVGKEISK